MVRNITERFVVLAPSERAAAGLFRDYQGNRKRHGHLLASLQRFRGAIYTADGAVPKSALTADGRHRAPGDDEAWHLISLGPGGAVRACLRYLEESNADDFDNLLAGRAAVASSAMAPAFRKAVEGEMNRARMAGLRFGEVGGWAVAEHLRNTPESIRILLAMYGLLENLGGCLGVATATWRRHSAAILRRIGLSALQADGSELPSYFDPAYDCQMEMLRFDSRRPNEKYESAVRAYAADLRVAPVVCGGDSAWTSMEEVWGAFDVEPALA